MSRVKGKDTEPERLVRSELHRMGYRFRVNVHTLPGNPDIVMARHKKIILVHGCFWHGHSGCVRAKRPASNTKFWYSKIDSNIERDRSVKRRLQRLGWKVLTLWQCETKNITTLRKQLRKFMAQP